MENENTSNNLRITEKFISDTVVGDNVLGDKFTGDKIDGDKYEINNSDGSVSALDFIYKQYHKELKTNDKFQRFIEDLDYYSKQVDGDVIGLEQKLKDGKQNSIISKALIWKELYHKKLMKDAQFSIVSQEINAFFLAAIESKFEHCIHTQICKDTPPQNINLLVIEHVIKPVVAMLGENPLKFTEKDINGMLYFLTGNCHIKWSK